MLLEFGKDNLINKALKQPDKVKQAFEKSKPDGVFLLIKVSLQN